MQRKTQSAIPAKVQQGCCVLAAVHLEFLGQDIFIPFFVFLVVKEGASVLRMHESCVNNDPYVPALPTSLQEYMGSNCSMDAVQMYMYCNCSFVHCHEHQYRRTCETTDALECNHICFGKIRMCCSSTADSEVSEVCACCQLCPALYLLNLPDRQNCS
jgi:hypothetical protein